MKRSINAFIAALFAVFCAACATTAKVTTSPDAINTSALSASAITAPAEQPAPTAAADPEQANLLHLQDRINLFASPRYIAHVQAAKAAGSDALQNACMDATLEIGADIKAKPLIVIQSADIGPVDKSCGWCLLAQKRKADAERQGGPSIIAQVADARRRLAGLARKGLVACAPLREDMRLSALNPENAAAGLFELLRLFDGGGE